MLSSLGQPFHAFNNIAIGIGNMITTKDAANLIYMSTRKDSKRKLKLTQYLNDMTWQECNLWHAITEVIFRSNLLEI